MITRKVRQIAPVLFICYRIHPNLSDYSKNIVNTGRILSLIIPAYNEEERLPVMLDVTFEYLNRNRDALTQMFNKAVGFQEINRVNTTELLQYEFIIVDDGSKDNTEGVVRKYAANVKSGDTVKLISMHQNCGKGGAVKMGMLRSSGLLCLMVDADGATDINDGMGKVLKEMEVLTTQYRNGASGIRKLSHSSLPPAAVFGSRAHLEEESCATRSKVRTFLMHAFHFFVKTLCSSRIKDTQCGFKLFTRSAVALLFKNLHLRRW